jgi:hypothetical protein
LHGVDDLNRGQFLGEELGRVEKIDAFEGLLRVVREYLDAQIPLGVGARLDGVGEITTVEVGVDPGGDLRLLPHQRMHPQARLPVELHQRRRVVRRDQSECVDAEALPSSGTSAGSAGRTWTT